MFWSNVGLKYLEFFTEVVSASDATVASLQRRASLARNGERQPVYLTDER